MFRLAFTMRPFLKRPRLALCLASILLPTPAARGAHQEPPSALRQPDATYATGGLIRTNGGDAFGFALPGDAGDVIIESGAPLGSLPGGNPLDVPREAVLELPAGITDAASINVAGTLILTGATTLRSKGTVEVTGAILGRIGMSTRDGASLTIRSEGPVSIAGTIDTSAANGVELGPEPRDGGRGGHVTIQTASTMPLVIPTILARGGDSHRSAGVLAGGHGGQVQISARTGDIVFGGLTLPLEAVDPLPTQPGAATLPTETRFRRGVLTTGGYGGLPDPFESVFDGQNGAKGGKGGDIEIVCRGGGHVTFADTQLFTGGSVENVLRYSTFFGGHLTSVRLGAPPGSLGGRGQQSILSCGGAGGAGGAGGNVSLMGCALSPRPNSFKSPPDTQAIFSLTDSVSFLPAPRWEPIVEARDVAGNPLFTIQAFGGSGGIPGGTTAPTGGCSQSARPCSTDFDCNGCLFPPFICDVCVGGNGPSCPGSYGPKGSDGRLSCEALAIPFELRLGGVDGTGRRIEPVLCTAEDRGANINVSLSASKDPVFRGESLVYTIDVRNQGPEAASNVSLVASFFPSQVRYVSDDCDGSANEGIWTALLRTTVSPSSAEPVPCRVVAEVQPGAKGPVEFSVSGTASAFDFDLNDNKARVETSIWRLAYYALGDSVAAGHGLSAGDGRKLKTCRNSEDAYPWRVAERLGEVERYESFVLFDQDHHLACSGAASEERHPTPGRTGCGPGPGLILDFDPCDLPEQVGRLPGRFPRDQHTLISISFGANDFDFVIESFAGAHICAAEDTYESWRNTLLDGLRINLGRQLGALLARENVFVVVTDYFNPYNKASGYFDVARRVNPLCQNLTDDFLRMRIERLVSGINRRLRAAVYGARRDHPGRVEITNIKQAFHDRESPMPNCGREPPSRAATFIQSPDSFSIASIAQDLDILLALINASRNPTAEGLLEVILLSKGMALAHGGDCFHPNLDGAHAIATDDRGVFNRALRVLPQPSTQVEASGEDPSPSSPIGDRRPAGPHPGDRARTGAVLSSQRDCCAPRDTAACGADVCWRCVCALDPYCCSDEWDLLCAGEATDAECDEACGCPSPTTTPTASNEPPTPTATSQVPGDCCIEGQGPGCNAATCEECVCGLAPDCCTRRWDFLCAERAAIQCVSACSCQATPTPTANGPPPTPGGDCCRPHGGPRCNEASCESCVCGGDPFCCEQRWDGLCADAAAEQCSASCSSCASVPTSTPTDVVSPTAAVDTFTPTAVPITPSPASSPSATLGSAITTTPTPPSVANLTPTPTVVSTVPATEVPLTTPTVTPTVTLRGDANCDGRLSAADLPRFLPLIASNLPPICGADVDSNGVLDTRDISATVAAMFGPDRIGPARGG